MEQLKQLIARLLFRRAHIKQILKNLQDELTEEQINSYLEELFEIEELIEKLKKGLE
ncbi:hypothetical protein [Emticicia fontis]